MTEQQELARDAAATMSRYVQFDTTNPPGAERAAAEWLRRQLAERGVCAAAQLLGPDPERPILLARIPGAEPLKPLVLNHHIDVVPADAAQWTHLPFSGAIAEGCVWGRGTLDTKCLGVMFLLALQGLLAEGARFRRPVVYLAVPDEERGGANGMAWLVDQHLADLDPEWVWDEGGVLLRGVLGERLLAGVSVAEKRIHQVRLIARGESGHGSMPHANNACATLVRALARLPQRPLRINAVTKAMFAAMGRATPGPLGWLLRHIDNPLVRTLVGNKLASNRLMNAMLRDTIAPTMLTAGQAINVLPEQAEAGLDCRLLPDTDPAEFEAWLLRHLADERITLEIIEHSAEADIAPVEGPFMAAVGAALQELLPEAVLVPTQMPGGSDARFFRQRYISAYGFGPFVLDQTELARIHGVDERISIDNLVLGTRICRHVIRQLCID